MEYKKQLLTFTSTHDIGVTYVTLVACTTYTADLIVCIIHAYARTNARAGVPHCATQGIDKREIFHLNGPP